MFGCNCRCSFFLSSSIFPVCTLFGRMNIKNKTLLKKLLNTAIGIFQITNKIASSSVCFVLFLNLLVKNLGWRNENEQRKFRINTAICIGMAGMERTLDYTWDSPLAQRFHCLDPLAKGWWKHKDCCRLFACMNPATDTSKRRLPEGIRSKFIEYYVNENDDASDLAKIVSIIILLIESV